MTNQKNSTAIRHIVCAVRGQVHSRATVSRAIDLALAHGARLTFVHVIDAEFLAYATVGIPRLMLQELRSMGEFLMVILKERAERRGVAQVDTALLEGHFDRALLTYLQRQSAEMVVLGAIGPSRGANALSSQEFEALVDALRTRGVQVEIVG